jgi:hypothetical protein
MPRNPTARDDAASNGTVSSEGTADESEDSHRVPTVCANCASPVDTSEWHPIATEVDEDDEFHLHAFCGDACRDAWADDN